jgi:hypothetical protein
MPDEDVEALEAEVVEVVEVVEDDTVVVVSDDGEVQGAILGLLNKSGVVSSVEDAARRSATFLRATKPSYGGSQHSGVRILPVVGVRRMVYYATDQPALIDDSGCAVGTRARADLGAHLDRWGELSANKSRAGDVTVREKLWRLSNRFTGSGGTVAATDMDAVQGCALDGSSIRSPLSSTIRLLGPTTVDSIRLHDGDEVERTGWLLVGRGVRVGADVKRMDRLDLAELEAFLASLVPKSRVRVMLDDDPPGKLRDGAVSADAAGVVIDGVHKPLRLTAPWESGAFLLPPPDSKWSKLQFGGKAALSDPGTAMCVVVTGDRLPDAVWLPAFVASLNVADAMASAGMQDVPLTPRMYAAAKARIEDALPDAGQADDAGTGETETPADDAGTGDDATEGGGGHELAHLAAFVEQVRQRNAADAAYFGTSGGSGGAMVGGAVNHIRASQQAKCADIERLPHAGSWGWWMNASFAAHATAPADAELVERWMAVPHGDPRECAKQDVKDRVDELFASAAVSGRKMLDRVSVLQGHLRLSDAVSTRVPSSGGRGDALAYDHVRALDRKCFASAFAKEAAGRAHAALADARAAVVEFKRSGGNAVVINALARTVAAWAAKPVAVSYLRPFQRVVDYGAFAGGHGDDADADVLQLVMGNGDMQFYHKARQPQQQAPQQAPQAVDERVLLRELMAAAGIAGGLTGEEERVVLNNVQYYGSAARDEHDALLRRQVGNVKQRRRGIIDAVVGKRRMSADEYEDMEQRIVQKLVERNQRSNLVGTVALLAALLSLLIERDAARLSPAAVSPGCRGGHKAAAEVHLADVMSCAAGEVIAAHGAADDVAAAARGDKKKATGDGGTLSMSDRIAKLAAAIERDKPTGALVVPTKRGRSRTSTAVDEWSGFRPRIPELPHFVAPGPAADLADAIVEHVGRQKSILLGFNRQPLKRLNACCMAAATEGAWDSMLSDASASASHLRDLLSRAASQSPDGGVASTNTATKVRRGAVVSDVSSDGWHAVGKLATMKGFPAVVPHVERLAQPAAAHKKKDDGAPPSDDDASAELGFDGLVAAAKLDASVADDLRAAFFAGNGAPQSQGVRGIAERFLLYDMGPALRRVARTGAYRTDPELADLSARLFSHQPASETATFIKDGLMTMAAGATVARFRGADGPDAANACMTVLYGVIHAGQPSPRLLPVAQSLVTLLMRRWRDKLRFNRMDTQTLLDDARRMDAFREGEKLKRAVVNERLGDEEHRILRELRKVRKVDVEQEFVGDGDNDNDNDAGKDDAGGGPEEDAKGMFWAAPT